MTPRSGGTRGKADMHLHTLYSDGTAGVEALLQHIETQTDLDLVAITDHERLDGALRAREIHAGGGYRFELVVGEEITTRRGCAGPVHRGAHPALRPLPETLERIHEQGGLAIAAHPLAPLTPSLGRRSLLALQFDPDPRHHLDAIELLNPSAAGRARRVERSASTSMSCSWQPSATRTPMCSSMWAPAGPGSRARRPRSTGRPSWSAPASRPASTGAAGTTSRSTAGSSSPRPATCAILCVPQESGDDAGPGCRGRRHADPSVQPNPVRGPLKVGIVSPYGYPHPGGVNEHVRYTYEAMRRLGHDVWIITSRYGKERETEGHVIRLGTGYAFPTNGSMGRVTLSWRFKERARDLLAEHRFDVLHFHEPLVPFLSPTMLDQSDTVNIGTFHAFGGFSPSYWIGARFASQLANKLDGRIAVSGAARHFISRYFPGEYRIIPNGVDLDRFADAEPFEELRDGTINILFVGRFEERKG